MQFSINKNFQQEPGVDWLRDQHALEDLDQLANTDLDFDSLLSSPERYSTVCLLGHGALKDVFKAYDSKLKRHIALAKSREGLDNEADRKLVHEAWITSRLNHPNIIKIHGIGVQDGRPFFTMDLKGNFSFKDYCAQTPELPLRLHTFTRISGAIAYAHAQGVIHLDLKPDNIQCGQYGEVLVCDWGLAKFDLSSEHLRDDITPLVQLRHETLYGEIKGTLGFLAPEQIVKGATKDFRSDIYALGCLLYYLLTDEAPHQGSKQDIIASTLENAGPNASITHPHRKPPKALSAIAMKAMAKDPHDRYQTVDQMQNDLSLYLSNLPTSLDQGSPLKHAQLFIKRHQRESILITSAIFLAALTATTLWARVLESRAQSYQLALQNKELENELSINKLESDFIEKEITSFSPSFNINHDLEDLWTHGPVNFIEARKRLLGRAAKKRPDESKLQRARTVACLITMDFKKGRSLLHHFPSIPHKSIQQLTQGLEEASYSQHTRPSKQELLAWLSPQRINHQKPVLIDLTATILHYDIATRPSGYDSTDVILQYWRFINSSSKSVKISHQPQENSLHIDTDGSLKHIPLTAKRSLFHYTQFDKTSVTTNGILDPCGLYGLRTSTLDLTQCNQINLRNHTYIYNLQQIITTLPKNHERAIRKAFQSNAPYQILFSDSTPAQE